MSTCFASHPDLCHLASNSKQTFLGVSPTGHNGIYLVNMQSIMKKEGETAQGLPGRGTNLGGLICSITGDFGSSKPLFACLVFETPSHRRLELLAFQRDQTVKAFTFRCDLIDLVKERMV